MIAMTPFMLLSTVAIAALGFGVVPMALYVRGEQRKREFEHIERMKALELGRPFPGEDEDATWFSPMRIAFAVGVGVPLGAFFSAALTSMAIGFHEPIWIATGIASLAGVISGSTVAGHHLSLRYKAAHPHTAKPYVNLPFD
jgi:hypothetical protein